MKLKLSTYLIIFVSLLLSISNMFAVSAYCSPCDACGDVAGCHSRDPNIVLQCKCIYGGYGSCQVQADPGKCKQPPQACVPLGEENCDNNWKRCCDGYCDTNLTPTKCLCKNINDSCNLTSDCCLPYACIGNRCVGCIDTGGETTNSSSCCSHVSCRDPLDSKEKCCADGDECGLAGCWKPPYPGCIDGSTITAMGATCSNGEVCVCDSNGFVCECDGGSIEIEYEDLIYNGPVIDNIASILNPIVKILYYGGLALGVFFIILSGYKLMTSQGDPQKTKEGQEQLTAAILGIFFILLSAAIIRIILNQVIGVIGTSI